jgi:hypothetical protein
MFFFSAVGGAASKYEASNKNHFFQHVVSLADKGGDPFARVEPTHGGILP